MSIFVCISGDPFPLIKLPKYYSNVPEAWMRAWDAKDWMESNKCVIHLLNQHMLHVAASTYIFFCTVELRYA